MSSYWCSEVTMALSCIVYEIKQDIGRKNRDFCRATLCIARPMPTCGVCLSHSCIALKNQRSKAFIRVKATSRETVWRMSIDRSRRK